MMLMREERGRGGSMLREGEATIHESIRGGEDESENCTEGE